MKGKFLRVMEKIGWRPARPEKSVHRCKLCGSSTKERTGYGRAFAECDQCGFIFALDYDQRGVRQEMGMEGSWSGPGGGGYREYYLVKMLSGDLNKKSFLLFGTGNTQTLGQLLEEGIDAVGCDISRDVIEYKISIHGPGAFFSPEDLPSDKKYDGIVAVEVFEHFVDPMISFQMLSKRLAPGGIICGTTNFYPGGPIEDTNNPGYMSPKTHVAYWSRRSITQLAELHGLCAWEFEMVRPGSVLPDEKFGQLWPNKRVFFIGRQDSHADYFARLRKSTPILPIDKP